MCDNTCTLLLFALVVHCEHLPSISYISTPFFGGRSFWRERHSRYELFQTLLRVQPAMTMLSAIKYDSPSIFLLDSFVFDAVMTYEHLSEHFAFPHGTHTTQPLGVEVGVGPDGVDALPLFKLFS